LGANAVVYSGKKDEKVEKSVIKVNESWGGVFEVKYVQKWKQFIRDWKDSGGEVIHLTMYGIPIQEVIEGIKESPRDKLVIIGGSKVPGLIYKISDLNISITSQPHSEISALSIFLHELFEGCELSKIFVKAKKTIVPNAKVKKVINKINNETQND
jgi:tRNA (cytidine56-2'-O)-methyltransferase